MKNTIVSCGCSPCRGERYKTTTKLNDLLLPFTKKGVRLTVIMDACHSGTNTRGTTLYELAGVKEVEASRNVFGNAVQEKKATTLLTEGGALTLGACQDNELSREATSGGKHFGAFTFCLCKSIKEYSKASAQEIFNRTIAQLKFLRYAAGARNRIRNYPERRKFTRHR